MSTRMLIDAAHAEETRVAVVRGNRIEDFDFESTHKRQLRGNIYLARVTRVEPSLQAAFVEYGGNRQGFLAFNEIHPDYYQIPVEDREALLAEEDAEEAADDDTEEAEAKAEAVDGEEQEPVEDVGADDAIEEAGKQRRRSMQRRYKIQEVIKRRQILLVQVVKEERGNKGAALTTYLSLAGRYCVLMPNTRRGGGVSRKIGTAADRKRLKKIQADLDVPEVMSCIIRTAGAERNKTEIKRDFEFLMKVWDNIRTLTMESIAPALIYEEGNLVKRAIRDLYSNEVDEVLVDGNDAYREAKDLMKMLMPSHAKRVQPYKDKIPLFHRFQVENQLETMYRTEVPLKSGGYLVINPTEALVSIDVNSGRSTRERNVEKTAYRTNLEAAEEVARQLRLRDLAGLIVIDFIDMMERSNNRGVERKLKECLKNDRARLQVGRISSFGLLEMSRQRMRPGVLEASTSPCPVCAGAGIVRSTSSLALHIIRLFEEEGIRGRSSLVTAYVPSDVAMFLLNEKRHELAEVEERFGIQARVIADPELLSPHYRVEREGNRDGGDESRAITLTDAPALVEAVDDDAVVEEPAVQEVRADDEENNGKRKRRSRRGGRRRRRNRDDREEQTSQDAQEQPSEDVAVMPDSEAAVAAETPAEADMVSAPAEEAADEKPKAKRKRSRRTKKVAKSETDTEQNDTAAPESDPAPGTGAEPAEAETAQPAPKAVPEPKAAPEPKPEPEPVAAAPEPEPEDSGPKRTGWWSRN